MEDVWIESVRALKSGIRFAGRTIAQNTPIEDLKRIFGPCRKVEGVKGGVFLNCESGLTLGLDFEERGDFVQLRLKPR